MTKQSKRMSVPTKAPNQSMLAALTIGDEGEQLVKAGYPHGLIKYRGTEYDFIRDDGAKVELKTDAKGSTATQNLFMERWTVGTNRKKPGSVWICEELGVDVFLYMFLGDKLLLECEDVPRLVRRVEASIRTNNLPLKVIPNRGYHGEGYAVPFAELQDLFVKYRCEDGKCERI